MMVLIFLFWDILLKVCNNACIMPSLGKKSFSSIFYSVFLKSMILLILEIIFCTIVVVIKPEFSFHKSIIFMVLCLVLTNCLFSTGFTRWSKAKLFC